MPRVLAFTKGNLTAGPDCHLLTESRSESSSAMKVASIKDSSDLSHSDGVLRCFKGTDGSR